MQALIYPTLGGGMVILSSDDFCFRSLFRRFPNWCLEGWMEML